MGRFDLRTTSIYAESWNVAWRKKAPGSILSDTNTPFIIIKNAYRYWAADPFVVERNGDTYIFAELYDYIRGRGILGCCKLEEGRSSKWIPILTEPFHLSYPCVIEYQDKIYLMPESGEGQKLLLYEAIEFPYRWKKSRVLREHVSFADTTPLMEETGHFALTHQVKDPYHPQLLLIDLDHPQKDRVIETPFPFRTRPAGGSFCCGKEKIRPAQQSVDCGAGYGKSLLFYRYELSEHGYQETAIKQIHPEDLHYSRTIFLDGMHTYNASQHYEVIDIKTRRLNLLNFTFRMIHKIGHCIRGNKHD